MESKVEVRDVVGLWASKYWVASMTSLIVIEGEGEGSVIVAFVSVGVTERKGTSGHQ